VGSGVRTVSTKQFLSLLARSRRVQPVGVGPGAGGVRMWNTLVRVTRFWLVLNSRREYI
jgi:hypothetical protein